MAGVVDQGGEVPGYTVPLHRALSEPIYKKIRMSAP